MSSTYRRDPAYDINRWLASELFDAGVLEATDYQVTIEGNTVPIRPIFPVQQPVPDYLQAMTSDNTSNPLKLNFHGEPFLVYDVAIPGYGTESFWLCEEQILYSIYARDFMDARETQVAMYDIFHRLDLSARDLNEYIAQDSPYRFHWVNVIDSPPPDPKDSPDDPATTFVMIEYQYARNIRADGRFAS